MRFKSIQTKYLLLVLSGVIISALFIGGVAVLNASRMSAETTAENMNLVCEGYTAEADSSLRSIEHSMSMMNGYAMGILDSVERLSEDEDYRKAFTSQLEELLTIVAGDTERVAAYYVRYAPELCSTNVGFLYRQSARTGTFEEEPLTVIEDYDPSDVGHVGWYYIPIDNYEENGQEMTWMDPYYNENLHVLMISCVAPMYKDGELVGIVGMDVNFQQFIDAIKELKISEQSNACLCGTDGRVYYHPDLYDILTLREEDRSSTTLYLQDYMEGFSPDMGEGVDGEALFSGRDPQTHEPVRFAVSTLSNGMHLVLSAPESEISENMYHLVQMIAVSTAVFVLFFVIITVIISRTIIRPLRELEAAAAALAKGDYDIQIDVRTEDEVASLARSFQSTAKELGNYAAHMSALAYRDALTGVRNTTAYTSELERLDAQVGMGTARFAIAVFDVNDLKVINDCYGHEQGNHAIVSACKRICEVFKHSPVFRVGGDEFVAVLEGTDLDHSDERAREFREAGERDNAAAQDASRRVHIAWGMAAYDPQQDASARDVFNRADTEMYAVKAKMKAQG